MKIKTAKSKKIKKGKKKKTNSIKTGYNLFRQEYSKRLKIEDPDKYKQIGNNLADLS
jgi:hypothetical protein